MSHEHDVYGSLSKWMDGITDSTDTSLSKHREIVKDREAWCTTGHGAKKSRTRFSNWTTFKLFRKNTEWWSQSKYGEMSTIGKSRWNIYKSSWYYFSVAWNFWQYFGKDNTKWNYPLNSLFHMPISSILKYRFNIHVLTLFKDLKYETWTNVTNYNKNLWQSTSWIRQRN